MSFMTRGAAVGPPARGATPPDRSRPVRPGRGRRGAALAEAVVAALVLAVGLLGTVGVVAGVARDVGRARAADAAGALLAERVAGWRRAPCAADAGERTVGALRERWRVAVVAEFGVLADTVTSAAGRPEPLVGVVAAAGCGP